MSTRKAFTLVEVGVAGALIGFCVLTAVAIIPRGLQTINEARMRAVAAAAIMTLSAKNSGNSSMGATVTNYTGPALIFEPTYIAGTTPPTNLKIIPTTAGAGELERRLLFSYSDGNNGGTPAQNTRVIMAWLLNGDPDGTPTRARYLATFTEFR